MCTLCNVPMDAVFLLETSRFQPSSALENLPDGFLINYTVNGNMTYSHPLSSSYIKQPKLQTDVWGSWDKRLKARPLCIHGFDANYE